MNSSSVIELVHRPQPFENAVTAFIGARNVECVAALHHHCSIDAAFLRTRALVRLGRLDDSDAVIRSVHQQPNTHADLAQYNTLLGTVLDRKGDYEGASEAFRDARAFAYGIPSVALHAELALYESYSAWRYRDFEQAEQIASDALNEAPKSYDEPHVYPLQVSHAFLYELLALLRGRRERHQVQIRFLKKGLDALAKAPQRHVWPETGLLWNMAALVPELRIPGVAGVMRAHTESLVWTPETAMRAYYVYRALGWSEALTGNYVAAFRDMREAHKHAPTNAWRIEALLDRAYLFGQTGEKLAAREHFDQADQLSRDVAWDEGENRYVLLWAAQIAAQLDACRSRALIAQYEKIRKPMDSTLLWSTECRQWRAHEYDAYGAVAAADGTPSIALNYLHAALTIWDALEFDWRAAKTAGTIAHITNATEDIAGARRRAEPFAKSWLARRSRVRN